MKLKLLVEVTTIPNMDVVAARMIVLLLLMVVVVVVVASIASVSMRSCGDLVVPSWRLVDRS